MAGRRLIVSVSVSEKTCPRCEELLPASSFYKNAARYDGLVGYCKACISVRLDREKRAEYNAQYTEANRETINAKQREYYHANRDSYRNAALIKRFGITLDDYRRMLDEQSGVCAICSQGERATDRRTGRIRALAVDHCHASGEVRGLLCAACNQSLGLLEESEDRMMNMIAYLEERS